QQLGVARFNSDGTADTTFGTNGQALTGLTARDPRQVGTLSWPSLVLPAQMLLQPDQKIVVLASVQFNLGLARFNSDRTLDSSFGTARTVVTSFGAGFQVTHTDAFLQTDGKIIVMAMVNFGNYP